MFSHTLSRWPFRRFVSNAVLSAVLLFALQPTRAAAAAEQPNIVLVMADDMGFSDLGCYGSEIDTPTLNQLANDGLRFTQFYNAARCCPTRAALLTGLYPHQAGVGKMVKSKPAEQPGPSQGYLNNQCVTIAEVLGMSGYRCYMSGKWHVGEFRPVWPIDRGFDHHYGLVSGGMNYFNINKSKRPGLQRVFARDEQRLFLEGDEFYATDAFGTEALGYLDEHARDHADEPFFLYLAFNAPHWPLHAPKELIDKYRGRYLGGWESLRRDRYERMVRTGIIKAEWKLSEADGSDWTTLSDSQRTELDLRMAVYAAMVERMDWNIGRVVQRLKDQDRFENTVLMFLSDNGACHEGGLLGGDMRPDLTDTTGTEDSYRTYGQSWSNAGNTPFRKHKHWTHEGGIATPLIIHWPRGLKHSGGSLTSQMGHVIDIMPTVCELGGAPYPAVYKGQAITPTAGESLAAVFRNESAPVKRTLYWEHMTNAAIRDGDWKLVRSQSNDWELYHMAADRSELTDLAAVHPIRTKQLETDWANWAARVGAE